MKRKPKLRWKITRLTVEESDDLYEVAQHSGGWEATVENGRIYAIENFQTKAGAVAWCERHAATERRGK